MESAAVFPCTRVTTEINRQTISPQTSPSALVFLTEPIGSLSGPAVRGRVLRENTPLISFALVAIEHPFGSHEALGTFNSFISQDELYLYHVWVLEVFLREDFGDLGAPH